MCTNFKLLPSTSAELFTFETSKRAKSGSFLTCTGKTWFEEKGDELSDEEARKFMVKIRTLLVNGGFPVDYGWRKGLPESIHTIGDKGEEKKSSSEEVRRRLTRTTYSSCGHAVGAEALPAGIHVEATSTATIASERDTAGGSVPKDYAINVGNRDMTPLMLNAQYRIEDLDIRTDTQVRVKYTE